MAPAMELTHDQVRAAEAAGCTFTPATPDQVARLTMQRRIFTIDGQPYVARRQGAGFYETQGTLAPLIAAASAGMAAPLVTETLQEAEEADASAALEIAAESRAGGGGGAKVVRRGRGRPPRGPRVA